MTEPGRAFARAVSISGDATGIDAVQYLVDPKLARQDDPGEMLVAMTGVTNVDPFIAAVVRATVEQHLILNDENTACIWHPSDSIVWESLHDMLGVPPERCPLLNDVSVPAPIPEIVVPAEPIGDMDEAGELATYIQSFAKASMILDRAEAGLIATSVPILIENSVRHAADALPPVLCLAIDRLNKDIVLAVVDLGDGLTRSSDPLRALGRRLAQSHEKPGGLTDILQLANRGGMTVSMHVASATARAEWRAGWRGRTAEFAPGWCTGLIVHRGRRSA